MRQVISTPGLIAPVTMLCMMEVMMNGKVLEWMTSMMFFMAWAVVAEGELSALAWLPAMLILALNHAASPEPMSPEYVPKRHRRTSTMDRIISWWTQSGIKITPVQTLIRLFSTTTLGTGRFNH
jgi:hypothetical protein